MRSTMLSSSRKAPKRYKGEEEDEDEDDDSVYEEVRDGIFPEFRLGGKIQTLLFVRTASGEKTLSAGSVRGRSRRTGAS